MVQINSFVFFDIETTGLRGIEKPKITELVFIACSRQHLLEGKNEVPRVKSKLLLPFNPEISIHPNASRITGRQSFMSLLNSHLLIIVNTVHILHSSK